MNKVTKRLSMGALAALMLFGGVFASTPAQASEYIGFDSLCQTGGPANTVTYRITQSTAWRTTHGTGLSIAIGGIMAPPNHVTRPSGPAEHRVHAGNQYRRVIFSGTVRWVRSAHLGVVHTC